MVELRFDWGRWSCSREGVAIDGAPSGPQLAAPPPVGSSLPSSPGLGALLEVPQLLLVVLVQHPHVAVGLTQVLEVSRGHMLTHAPTHTLTRLLIGPFPLTGNCS